MAIPTDHTKLFSLLDKAERSARKFRGGYSGEFLSGEEFHQALYESITKFKQADKTQVDKLYTWFLPTSCWDDFSGMDGLNLGNGINELLSSIVNKN